MYIWLIRETEINAKINTFAVLFPVENWLFRQKNKESDTHANCTQLGWVIGLVALINKMIWFCSHMIYPFQIDLKDNSPDKMSNELLEKF